MAIRVILKSPYGRFKVGKRYIQNGRLGWTTGEADGQKLGVRFDGRKTTVFVPQHWAGYHKPRTLRAKR